MKNSAKLFLVMALSLTTLLGAKSVEYKIKDAIDSAAEALKHGVENIGDDLEAAQAYLDNYPWRGILEDETRVGAVTLKHLQLKGRSRVVAARPGERIEGSVVGMYDKNQCSPWSYYRVVLGIYDKGPQTTICESWGGFASESLEHFTLIAPAEKGLYRVSFQPVEAWTEASALEQWNQTDKTATLGLILVN